VGRPSFVSYGKQRRRWDAKTKKKNSPISVYVYRLKTLVERRKEHGKNGFVTATKLGTDNFFVAATKNFAEATKRFVERTKHFVVITKYFCDIPILTNDFVSIAKPFFP